MLYHFLGRSVKSEDEQYELLTKIIKDGWLTFPPHENSVNPGQIKIDSFKERKINEMFIPECVCFADIPKDQLKIHMEKYSKFGIGFSKSFLVKKGVNPVFYIDENSLVYKMNFSTNMLELTKKTDYYQENCSKAMWYFISKYLPYCQKSEDEYRDTWEIYLFLTNIFSHFKVWNSNLEDSDPSNYYFEREWRAINNIDFQLSDIVMIIIPKNYETQFRENFPGYTGKIEFSD
ncbi:abortive infection system antitoxin AbiGi family protein [Methanosarcina sp.]|uniref:abortive infection system antitoxin AbiGi family protein n=1 Tax=Methanosarcina sp. TaxID=2213 RepID=UPI003C710D9E